MMIAPKLYNDTCVECSQLLTRRYSTSFSMGIRFFHKRFRAPIYSIYGFVRVADEIVDSFHETHQDELLDEFREDLYRALDRRISTNPVLHSFQQVVYSYGIDREYIDAFMDSMAMDLDHREYTREEYDRYIYGSAEVIGLMCLRVFTEGDDELFEELKEPARQLGSAFQKVNFIRDIKSDFEDRARVYFPELDIHEFTEEIKDQIEADIEHEFESAYQGIRNLPRGVRSGVMLAYHYYRGLFNKIRKTRAHRVMERRIRIPNFVKFLICMEVATKEQISEWMGGGRTRVKVLESGS